MSTSRQTEINKPVMIKILPHKSCPYILRYYLIVSAIILGPVSYSQVTNPWNKLIEYDDGLNYQNNFVKTIFAGIVGTAKDGAGNVYVTGAVNGINRGSIAGQGSKIIYTRKYNISGSLVWEKWYFTYEPDVELRATGIAVTGDQIVYVIGYRTTSSTGYTSSERNLVIRYNSLDDNDDGKAVSSAFNYIPTDLAVRSGNLYVTGTKWSTSTVSHAEYYTVKYDADLNIKWARSYSPSSANSYANALTVNHLGNVYVTGKSGAGTNHGMVTVQYAQDGTLMRTAIITGSAHFRDEGYDVEYDIHDNIYVTGYVTDGTPGEGQTYNRMYTTVKYDAELTQLWINKYDGGNGPDVDEGLSIATDNFADDNIVVAGRSRNVTVGYFNDIVTIKYDPVNGTRQWVKRYSGPASPVDIQADNKGNYYITGDGTGDHSDIITFKYDAAGNEKWRMVYTSPGTESDDRAQALVVDDANIYVGGSANDAGVLIRYLQCNLSCPANILVNNTAGQCGAAVNYHASSVFSVCGSPTYSIAPGSFFPVGETTVNVSSATGGETCSFTVTVKDTEAPLITAGPANVTVSCVADIPAVNTAGITATDNCGTPVITHVGDVISNQTCASRYILTRTYKATDPSLNFVTKDQVITVNDNTPPQIIGLNLSQQVLWPANHTMRDIAINYDVADNCTTPTISVIVSSNEPVNGTGDGDTDPDWEVVDAHHVRLRSERSAGGNGRIYTIAVTVSDGCNAPVTQTKTVIVAHNITGPITGRPFPVGSTVDFTGVFWDKAGNKHTGQWLIDDNTIVKGIITEPLGNKNGKLAGTYKFTTAGVYKLQMNVTDQNKLTSYTTTNGDLEEIIVIYDPDGGYAYGGGWFNSTAGALTSDPVATGKVSYGFTVNYFKGATFPKGETQFEFKIGELEYNALNFEYLSINGYKAVFKGSGKIIGGQSGTDFIMFVTDGGLDGTGVDKVRIRIFNKNTSQVYYDNQPGASDAANPTTPVGANSTVVISGTVATTATVANRTAETMQMTAQVEALQITATPNPSHTSFRLSITSTNKIAPAQVTVTDLLGRVVESRTTAVGQIITIGDKYRMGVYVVRIVHGKEVREVKLIKLPD